MIVLDPVELTASGRPLLLPGEVEHLLLDKVDLEFEPQGGLPGHLAKAYKAGYVILTSHRTMWIEASPTPAAGSENARPKRHSIFSSSSSSSRSKGAAATAAVPQTTSVAKHCGMPVSAVRSVAKRTTYALSGPKVRLHLDVAVSTTDHRPMANGQGGVVATRMISVVLRCRGSSPDVLAAKLEELLRAAPPPPQPAPAGDRAAPPAHSRPPPPPPPTESPPAQPPTPSVNAQMLAQLMDMGFPRHKSAHALAATSSADLQAALDFLLSFGHLPELDKPWPPPALPPSQPYAHQPPQQQPSPPALSTLGQHGPAAGGYPLDLPAAARGGRLPPLHPPNPAAALGSTPAPAPNLQQQPQQPQQPQQQPSLPWMMDGSLQPPCTINPLAMPPKEPELPARIPSPGKSEGQNLLGTIGISGIVRREQMKSSQAGRSLSVAFQDLSALMTMAQEMVALANKFRAVSSTVDASKCGDNDVMDAETQADLIAMGITSPVTKETAGARYQVELCRQLADFLQAPLVRAGGIMPLTDVFCLFNRARGTELVSPDDLLAAATLFSKVGLPLCLRTFPSGFMVIQSAAHSDDAVCAAIERLVQPKPLQPPEPPPQQQQRKQDEGAAPAGALRGTPQALPGGKVMVMPPAPSPAPGSPAAAAAAEHLAQDDLSCGRDGDSSDGNVDLAAREAEGCEGNTDMRAQLEASLGPAVTAPDVARALQVATAIAAEHLLTAETRGVVCRDEGPEGTRFFRNFFKDDWPPLVHC